MSSDRPRSAAAIWRPLVVVVAFVLVGAIIEVFFVRTESGQRLDASTFGAVVPLRELLGSSADTVRLIVPVMAVALGFVVLVVAIVRRRWRAIAFAAVLVVLAWVVSTVLKEIVVERPDLGDFGYSHNSFPSGHTAVSVAVLIAVLWMLPRPMPILVIPLALLGGAAGLAQVVSYAHRLSDVLGGALVAGAIAALALARGGLLRGGARALLWAGVVLVAAAGAWCVLGWQTSDYAADQLWLATAGIGLCATACAGASLIVGLEARRFVASGSAAPADPS